MRVLKYLFTTLFLVVVVFGVGFLAARKVLLVANTNKLVDSLEVLKLSAARNVASTECFELAGGNSATDQPIVYQIRFLNDVDYVLEAVCPLNQSNPIELGTNALAPFVKKVPGKSGFVWDESFDTGIELEVFGELAQFLEENTARYVDSRLITLSRKIVVENGVVNTAAAALPDSQQPVATCAGYGFTCCDTISQVGSGGQLTGASQCSDHCFRQCLDRPVVLSFATNPFFNPNTRQVDVVVGTPVTFAFVVDEKDTEDFEVVIDFGDGQSETFYARQGQVAHEYDCPDPFCSYTAELTVTDPDGLSSIETPISKIAVNVSR